MHPDLMSVSCSTECLMSVSSRLHVVQNGVHEHSDVWVLIGEELEHNRDHLGLVEHDLSRWAEEEELEEGVQDLLDHLIILLLGSKELLKELDQVGARNDLSAFIVTADGADKHDALEQDVILCVLIHQVVVQEFDHVAVSDLL